MSGRPKYVSAVTPPRRDVTLEQKAKHHSQIAAAKSAAVRSMRQAEATGALTAPERQELLAILSRLDAAAAMPIWSSLGEFRSTADRAAEDAARAYTIKAEAERRAVEIAARSKELEAIDWACNQDLTKIADPALHHQATSRQAGLAELRRTLTAGRLTAAEATAQRLLSEKALADLLSAQSALDAVGAYVADLSHIGIDCTNEQLAAQQRIRLEPAQSQALKRDFETLARARLAESSERLRQKEAEEVAARYAQWSALSARVDDARAEAEKALRASKAEAPDAASAVEQSLQKLSAAVRGLGERWAPAEIEPAFAGFDAALAALGDAVESRRKVREEVARRADEHEARLRSVLKGGPDVDDAQAQDIENEIAGLRNLASLAHVERRSREIEVDIRELVAAAAKPGPDISAPDAVVAALTRLGEAHGATWDEETFGRLRAARLGEAIIVSGQFDADGSTINLIVRFSQDGAVAEDAAGTKVDIECHDGEGRSCDLVKDLPRALSETGAFAEAAGHASSEGGHGYEWAEEYRAETAHAESGDGDPSGMARELAR
jgi:hypothetical protein